MVYEPTPLPTSPLDDVPGRTDDDELGLAEYIVGRERSHEDGMIRYILTQLGRQHLVPELLRQARDMTGEPLLSPYLFMAACHDFPVWLGFRRIWKSHEDFSEPNRIKRFTTTRVVEAWDETKADAEGWDGPVGVVFHMPHWPGGRGAVVLHNAAVALPANGYWAQRRIRNEIYTIEQLSQFMDRLREPLA